MKRLHVFLVTIMAYAMCFGQFTSLPYFNGFENPNDTAGWTFKKRKNTSGFEVGGATHCLGFKSMYISSDSGATATYIGTSNYVSIAYKSFTLPAGTYNLAFDYQCSGDGTNQDMKVAWVPASTSLAASALGQYSNAITLNQFTDSTGANVFGKTAWRHVTGTITVPAGGGTYNLCFAFRNGSSKVYAPGACVDNIQLDTVKTSSDCTQIPYNIQVTKDPQVGVIITWSGNATEYEIIGASASDPLDYSFCQHTGITTTSDTMQYSELSEGQYFFYVRAICGTDTGMYAESSGHIIYDSSAHCIDFVTFNAPGTQCTYGNYTNPYATNGYIDNGPSQKSSRHTIHTDLYETDPRTCGALNTVPAGEIMSVRLGNWNNGSEAESVTYTYVVPTGSNLILMMKYAIVFEEPGHSQPPEFKLEIMNVNNQLLDAVCTKANFLCDGTLTQGWHSCQAIGSYSSLSTIWWKEWTTIGVNLTQYAGQTVKIRLTTYDCNASGHFGYAYYTLDCSPAELTGMSCGSGESTEIKAPDGFVYLWINSSTGLIESTTQSLQIANTDTCKYLCRCFFKENYSCYFDIESYTHPHLPEASFSYSFSYSYSDCQTHVSFTNNSFVYLVHNGLKMNLSYEEISSQIWQVKSNNPNSPYYNATSFSNAHLTIDVPSTGDTLTVTLSAFANGCDDDTTLVIYVPAIPEYVNITNYDADIGEDVFYKGKTYRFISADSLEIKLQDNTKRYIVGEKVIQVRDTFESPYGCDSIVGLNIRVTIADIMVISNDTIMGITSGSGRYSFGTDVILSAIANENYHFVEWSDGNTDNPRSITVNGDSSFIALFEIDKYNIGASANNDDYGTVIGGGTYDYGSEIVISAVPNPHYEFIEWSNEDTASSFSWIVYEDTSFTAIFRPLKYNVVGIANDDDCGTVSGSGVYEYGSNVSLVALPNEGFILSYWSNGETEQAIFIAVESDTTVTAVFSPISSVKETTESKYVALVKGLTIFLNGAENQSVRIFDMTGKLVAFLEKADDECSFDMQVAGVYLIKIGDYKSIQVVVK